MWMKPGAGSAARWRNSRGKQGWPGSPMLRRLRTPEIIGDSTGDAGSLFRAIRPPLAPPNINRIEFNGESGYLARTA